MYFYIFYSETVSVKCFQLHISKKKKIQTHNRSSLIDRIYKNPIAHIILNGKNLSFPDGIRNEERKSTITISIQ